MTTASKRVGFVRKKPEIKLFVILLVCTAFVFSFSHFGSSAYQAMTSDSGGFDEGTMIGPVDVTGKSKEETLTLLSETLQKWRSETSINLQYKEKKVPVDVAQFQFDLENTVEMAQDGQQNEVIVTFKSGDLYQYLQNLSGELDSSSIKLDPMLAELISYGANFQSGQHVLKVDKYLVAGLNDHEVISEASITPEFVPIELGLLVEELSPIKIEPQAQVSLLKLLEERQFTTFPSEAASMIASVIYQTILASNFNVVEKHTSQVLPEYLELGLEAKVDYDNHLDFIFANPNETSYEIALELDNNTLSAYLKGSSFLNSYKVKLSDKEEFEPKTIVQFSPLLNPNAVKVQEKGSNGLLIKVYRQVYGESDEWLRNDFISEDFYPPIHTVEIHGLKSTQGTGTTDGTGGTTGTTPGTTTGTGNTQGGNTDGTNGITPTVPNPSDTDDGYYDDDDDLFGKPNETTK
jgi:hypothetical protein